MDEKKTCSVCKEKPATLFFTKISSDNQKQNLDLCDACAKAKVEEYHALTYAFGEPIY
jgi:protein-arginine kinase activator protein McsA